jgi:hypothetical protein
MFTNSGSADISLKHDVIVILLLGVSIMVQAIENVCCKAKIFGCFAFHTAHILEDSLNIIYA